MSFGSLLTKLYEMCVLGGKVFTLKLSSLINLPDAVFKFFPVYIITKEVQCLKDI